MTARYGEDCAALWKTEPGVRAGFWDHDEGGSLNAVYGLLRSLGVRWFMHGELGEVVPAKTTISLTPLNQTVKLDYPVRAWNWYNFSGFNYDDIIWARRLGMNSCNELLGPANGPHGLVHVLSDPATQKAHPEYYALTPEFVAGLPLAAGEKLVMVGHSLGAGFSVEVARALCGWNRIVHGLIGIDGVSPIWWGEGARPTRRFDGRGEQPLFKPFCGKWVGNTWDVVIPWNVEKVAWYYRGAVPTVAQPSNVTSGVWSFPIRGVETQIDVAAGPAVLGRTPKILANKCYGTPAKGDPHGQWCWEAETINMATAMAA